MKKVKSKFVPALVSIAGLLSCGIPVHAQASAESALEQVVGAAGVESLPSVAVLDVRSAAARAQESQSARVPEQILNHPTCELLLFEYSISFSPSLEDLIKQSLQKRGYHVLVTSDITKWQDAKVGDLRGKMRASFCVIEVKDLPFLPAKKSCGGRLQLMLVRDGGVETLVNNGVEEETRFGNPVPKAIRKLLDGVPVCRQSVK